MSYHEEPTFPVFIGRCVLLGAAVWLIFAAVTWLACELFGFLFK